MTNTEDIKAFERLVQHAKDHVVKLSDVRKMCEGMMAPVGDDEEFTCVISTGFRVVLSHEEQPSGLYQHLSISRVDGVVPSPRDVSGIMPHVGMGDIHDCASVWFEDRAVNILRKVDDGTDR
jgi:hypothetical protein